MDSTHLHRFLPGLCVLGLLMLALGGVHALRAEPENLQTPATAAKQPNADPGSIPRTAVDQYGDPLPDGVLSRLGTVRFRHSSAITAVAFDPRGQEVITASQDRMVNCWDLGTGVLRRQFRIEGNSIICVVFAPNGKMIAAGDFQEQSWLRQESTLNELRALREHVGGFQTLFSPDSRMLASVGDGNTIAIWETTSGKELHRIRGHDDSVYTLAFAPGGQIIATAGMAKTIRLWDTRTGEEVQRLDGVRKPVVTLAFSPDGKTLASGGKEAKVRFWDLATHKEVRQIPVQAQVVSDVAFTRDGKMVAVASREDADNGENHRGGVELFDASNGMRVRRIAGPRRNIEQVEFSPDGKTLVATGGNDTALHLWEVATGRELGPSNAHRGAVVEIAVAPDNRTVATAATDNTVRIWDAFTSRHLQRVDGSRVWFCDKGDTLLTIVDGEERSLVSWDVVTGREKLRQNLPSCNPSTAGLSADGSTLALEGPEHSIRLWDVSAGKELGRLVGHDKDLIGRVVFSPDGKKLASASFHQKLVFVWDLPTRRVERRFEAEPFCVAFSPDGRLLAAIGETHGMLIWDVATGVQIHRLTDLKIPWDSANEFRFSRDMRMVVLRAMCGEIWLVETATGRIRRKFETFPRWASSACLSPNGRLLIAGASDTTALVWDLRGNQAKPAALSTNTLASLWDDLASEDASLAYDAIGKLVTAADQCVPFLRSRMKPVAKPDEVRIASLIAKLDNDDFEIREKALEELAGLGEAALPALRKALSATTSLEVRRRAGLLLEPWDRPTPVPEQLRLLRALEVLEYIGTAEARAVLETLARGEPQARLTNEAQVVLKRWGDSR
jgi:WD40 repeat protein